VTLLFAPELSTIALFLAADAPLSDRYSYSGIGNWAKVGANLSSKAQIRSTNY
jgi:hypothetical protein